VVVHFFLLKRLCKKSWKHLQRSQNYHKKGKSLCNFAEVNHTIFLLPYECRVPLLNPPGWYAVESLTDTFCETWDECFCSVSSHCCCAIWILLHPLEWM